MRNTIDFNIKLKDEICDEQYPNKRYKVRTRDGKDVKIICWDFNEHFMIGLLPDEEGGREIIRTYNHCGIDVTNKCHLQKNNLVLVDTKVPELSRFAKEVKGILESYSSVLLVPFEDDKHRSDFYNAFAEEIYEAAKNEYETRLTEEVNFMLSPYSIDADKPSIPLTTTYDGGKEELPCWKEVTDPKMWEDIAVRMCSKPGIVTNENVVIHDLDTNKYLYISWKELLKKLPKE